MNNIDYLKKSNLKSVENINNNIEKRNRRDDLAKGQSPFAIIVCCSDSRVVPEDIFNVSIGDLFVIRTAGNVINEGELATIEYGIEHLKCKTIVVMGHTHCGAVHASIHNEKGKYIAPIINRIRNNILNETDEKIASIINANKEVAFLKEKFPTNEVEIISALFDLETSKVEFFE